MKILNLLLMVFFSGLLSGGLIADSSTNESLSKDPRLSYVGKLIYESHGAKQVEQSANEEAVQLYSEAKFLYQQAVDQSDMAQSGRLLDQALKKMMTAVRLSRPETVKQEKNIRDFKARKDSVDTLLDAHDRVAKEKNQKRVNEQLHLQTEALFKEAKKLYDEGKFDQARKVMDGAYVMVKTSVKSLRGGDTLVRSLNFASTEEEYLYEVDRNDTHKMLIKVLLDKKKKSANVDMRIKQYEEKSLDLRLQAEESAGRGDFKGALKLIEESTYYLVKAIRSGGVYIPG
ncbi:MAG: hypothetical protein V7699_00555 [Porticoccus sp.]